MAALDEPQILLQSAEPAPKIAFISGHIDITPDQFVQHYSSPLETSIAANHNFILSTAKGADTLALEYLLSHNLAPSRITVYIAQPTNPRKGGPVDVEKYTVRGLRVEVVDGWHTERDAEMTRIPDDDVLWVRPEEETRVLYGERYRAGRISETRKNEERRERLLSREGFEGEGRGK